MPRRTQHPSVGAHTYDHVEAPLAAAPSAITLRALERMGPGTLYTLLHLETLAVDDLPSRQQSEADAELASIEAEYACWDKVQKHLRGAIAAAQRIPNVAEHGLRITQPDREPIQIKMLDVFQIFESAAEHTAKRFIEVNLGKAGMFPGKLATARRMAKLTRSRRKELTNTSVRSRLTSLLAVLTDWSPNDIAELIIASQHDWKPAPVKLAPKYLFNPSDIDGRDRVAASHARQRREALLQWIRDQRKALDHTARRRADPKRRRKREI